MNDGLVYHGNVVLNKDGYLFFSSVHLEECVQYYITHKCEAACFSSSGFGGDFTEGNLDVLKKIQVKRLMIFPSGIGDISAINSQTGLEDLKIHSDPAPGVIDFSNFPLLKSFTGYWTSRLKNLFKCESLQHLRMNGYKSKTGDLQELNGLTAMRELELYEGSFENVTGIAAMMQLKSLSIGYNKKFKSMKGAAANKHLTDVELESCRSLLLESFGELAAMKKLSMENCGSYPSFESLLALLPQLEHFSFPQTALADPDNEYFLHHPSLKKVYFINKKGFRYTCEEINAKLNS